MNFNFVDLFIVAVLGLSLIAGMYKGFIASGLTAVGFVGAWFGAMNLYPQVANAIMGNSSFMNIAKYYLDAGSMFEPKSLGDTLVQGAVENGLLKQAIEGIKGVPQVVIDAFRNNVTEQMFSNTNLNNFTDYLGQTVLASAINVLAFILVFVVLYLVLLLVVNLLNNVFHFPLLRHFDWLLGGVFGLARGAVIMLLILAVVPMVMAMVNLDVVQKMMDTSWILTNFYPKDFTLAIPEIVKAAFSKTF